MLRTAVKTLREPRYAAFAALMTVVALICVAAGTWQISRFRQSVHDNRALRANARAAAVPLTPGLVALAGRGATPDRDDIRYRTVTVTGTYLAERQQFVRLPGHDGTSEFTVLTPLQTATAVLLVARGTVTNHSETTPPRGTALAPGGTVRLTGRLQTAQTGGDVLGPHEVAAIDPAEQAGNFDVPVYNAYLSLDVGQPGSNGVTIAPPPDLSNPAGGAYEAQHFAYIFQWYVFALLALAAPFAMRRHDVREAQRRFLDIDPDAGEFDDLESSREPAQLTSGSGAGELATRRVGLVHLADARVDIDPQRWERGVRLADRYGMPLDGGPDEPALPAASQAAPPQRSGRAPDIGLRERVENSAQHPHRSHDAVHGSYNDYLWQLALADGTAPALQLPPADEEKPGDPASDNMTPGNPR